MWLIKNKASMFVEYVVLVIAVTISLIVMSKWARKFIIGRAKDAVKSAWGDIEDNGNLTRTLNNKLEIVLE